MEGLKDETIDSRGNCGIYGGKLRLQVDGATLFSSQPLGDSAKDQTITHLQLKHIPIWSSGPNKSCISLKEPI